MYRMRMIPWKKILRDNVRYRTVPYVPVQIDNNQCILVLSISTVASKWKQLWKLLPVLYSTVLVPYHISVYQNNNISWQRLLLHQGSWPVRTWQYLLNSTHMSLWSSCQLITDYFIQWIIPFHNINDKINGIPEVKEWDYQ